MSPWLRFHTQGSTNTDQSYHLPYQRLITMTSQIPFHDSVRVVHSAGLFLFSLL